ncbi:STAS domain-containing protein [Blastococcus sp. TF02-8]|uniref:STAS domain-containing protein n=1 Tax=Blastococcus sp. TF02-8 TaxID=2250574 RepID=UPI001412B958|nr:STAS domain-containing protein [Blastococcus sp. TF02-8]
MEDGGPVLHLAGEIDIATVMAYEDHRDPSADGGVVAVDCSQVTFFSSTGLRLVLGMTQRMRDGGERPLVRGAPRTVLRVFELTGLSTIFDVVPPETE